jgi:glycerophosphoryl diester phosphodiesterase
MSWPYPRIIAHRGGGSLAPENTLAAMKKGAALGFKGVEFDVKLAKDATAFLLHDDTLQRTSNGKGPGNALTAAELSQLDAGGWFSQEYAGEPVPRFDAVAQYLIAHGTWANVEIKPSKGCDDETGKAVALATRELWRDVALKPVLSSFSLISLRAAKVAVPELPRGYLVDDIPREWAATMRELECAALHCNWKKLTRELASAIKAAGYGLLVWTVNDPLRARELLSWGVDALVTDRLDLITPDFA